MVSEKYSLLLPIVDRKRLLNIKKNQLFWSN